MKKAEPCAEFASRNPGEGAHYPNPCTTCGWSSPDHDNHRRAQREAAMEAALTAVVDLTRFPAGDDHIEIPDDEWRDVIDQARAAVQKDPST